LSQFTVIVLPLACGALAKHGTLAKPKAKAGKPTNTALMILENIYASLSLYIYDC